MNSAVYSKSLDDASAILDRHAVRRSDGIPTISLLVGSLGAGARAWRRWEASGGRSVVVALTAQFPCGDWIRSAAGQTDLRAAAARRLAERAEREPHEFLAAWQVKTDADRERFYNSLTPSADDDLLQALAALAVGEASTTAAALAPCLGEFGERLVTTIVCLDLSANWPSVLFTADSSAALSSLEDVAAKWAMRVPALRIAVATSAEIWNDYLAASPESRAKAILKEGEVAIPRIDAATVELTLTEAGATGSAAATVAAGGADDALIESAVAAIQATAVEPQSEAEDNRARSAAERFLFEFLESLPETAGRFELNGALDFRFGPRNAEVDILCRSPRIAIELDGYFHFVDPDSYRRDREKDWEMQRRGFVVLRFLAEDVIPQLELIRDRILDALTVMAELAREPKSQ